MPIKQVFSAYDNKDDTHIADFKYCPSCGIQMSLNEDSGKQRPACPNCGYVQFQNPIPGVVVVIVKKGQVLLGKRAGSFGKGKWGLPQGYNKFEEDFISAAIREVKEETGLDVEIRSIINVVSNFLSPVLHTLAIVLLAGVISGEPCAADDLLILEWYPLSELLPKMAFEANEFIIKRCQQNKLQEALQVDQHYSS